MTKKKEALGKGIRALLQDIDSNDGKQAAPQPVSVLQVGVSEVPLTKIEVNPFQPRADFDDKALNDLAESIKVHGVVQPITVRKLKNGNYQLIAGERRTRASRIAGLTKIPAYIKEVNDQEMLEIALIENIQREDLNPLEIGLNYQRLLDECQLTQEALASRIGKSRPSIANHLRLLNLPTVVQKGLKEKAVSMGHARALLSLDTEDAQIKLFKRILANGLSVRDVERLVKETKAPEASKNTREDISAEWLNYRNLLSTSVGWPVTIRSKGKGKGEIVISFRDEKELERLVERLDNDA
ncbi:MAG: ParB/RepB/Spo0J family partition protein [Saprospiraceae bacterium]|nr:ParB/RepB/Spo0J family partition protein [Saprospiraceae bacterium]